MPFRLAHISDLHVGKDEAHDRAAAKLATGLMQLRPDWIALTGDVTESGLAVEADRFNRFFRGLLPRMTIVPGNHDRCGDDAARAWSKAPAWIERPPRSSLSFICLDSTQPLNSTKFIAHGHLDEKQRRAAVSGATAERALGRVPIVLLHHHLTPLAADGPLELLAEWGDLPFLDPLEKGKSFADALGVAGVPLVLHGHKHTPAQTDRPSISIVNAGSTTELGSFRVFDFNQYGWMTDGGWFGF